jgi:hypothetical protein
MPRTLATSLLLLVAACAPTKPDPFAELLPPAALAALQDPDRLELMTVSIEPVESSLPKIQGHAILGKVDITDAGVRRELTVPLVESIRAGVGEPGSKCFSPRHALRAVKGADQVDLVVCFQCSDVVVVHGGKATMTRLADKHAQPAFVRETAKAGLEVDSPAAPAEPAPPPTDDPAAPAAPAPPPPAPAP